MTGFSPVTPSTVSHGWCRTLELLALWRRPHVGTACCPSPSKLRTSSQAPASAHVHRVQPTPGARGPRPPEASCGALTFSPDTLGGDPSPMCETDRGSCRPAALGKVRSESARCPPDATLLRRHFRCRQLAGLSRHPPVSPEGRASRSSLCFRTAVYGPSLQIRPNTHASTFWSFPEDYLLVLLSLC